MAIYRVGAASYARQQLGRTLHGMVPDVANQNVGHDYGAMSLQRPRIGPPSSPMRVIYGATAAEEGPAEILADAAGTIIVASAAQAESLIQAGAAGTIVVTGASVAQALIAAAAQGAIAVQSASQATAEILAAASGAIAVVSAAQAESLIVAESAGAFIVTGASTAIVTDGEPEPEPEPPPPATGGGGAGGPDYRKRGRRRKPPVDETLPEILAEAHGFIRVVGHATAEITGQPLAPEEPPLPEPFVPPAPWEPPRRAPRVAYASVALVEREEPDDEMLLVVALADDDAYTGGW